jgi:hypothetical protein
MSAGVAFALLSVAIQVLTLLADRAMGRLDVPMFRAQVAVEPMYGFPAFFSAPGNPELADMRIRKVLRMALVASAGRAALTAQVAALAALYFTREIVDGSNPPYEQLRVTLDIGAFIVVMVFFAWLLMQVAGGQLRPVPPVAPGAGAKERVGGYLRNVRQPRHLTMFATVTFLANLVAVGTAIGA